MQKKRLPAMLKKAARLLKMPPVLVAKVRKSMKTRSMKKFMLLRHYNYGFVREYQFSPSNSPLIHQYYRTAAKKRWYQDFDSVWSQKAISLARSSPERARPLIRLRDSFEREEEEEVDEDSIDERAERFIERFYEEIRIQRQRSTSLVQYNPFILD